MALEKQLENQILNDLQGDAQTVVSTIGALMNNELWSDEKHITHAHVQQLLYIIKQMEQKAKYLGGMNY